MKTLCEKMHRKFKKEFKGKRFLITGGTGYIGSEIVRQLLKCSPKTIRIFSNDENGMFTAKKEFGRHENVRFLIGDVRDKERLVKAMEDVDVVYHAAALKHVPLCEYNPFEAIQTNVIGTQNVIEAALKAGVGKVINISTDKVVNPINTMGATKLLAEKLISSSNLHKGNSKTVFSSVRFGNVLFSRGSVVPTFLEQIRKERKVTVTDPNMTRFVMLKDDMAHLLFKATILAEGGETFILKMPVVRLGDLVDVLIETYPIKGITVAIKKIGLRPGEKFSEDLMTGTEIDGMVEVKDMFIASPNKRGRYPHRVGRRFARSSYSSGMIIPLSRVKVKKLLWNTKGRCGCCEDCDTDTGSKACCKKATESSYGDRRRIESCWSWLLKR